MSKKYNYTLIQTALNPDGTITAMLEAALADGQGRHFERATGPDLKSIYARLGISPVEQSPAAPEPQLSNARTIENLAVSNV